jgi:hypothetical protein
MNLGIHDHQFESAIGKRCKRKTFGVNLLDDAGSGVLEHIKTGKSDRVKRSKHDIYPQNTFPEEDKENCHRVKFLAPRARTAKVLVDLIVDAPTDCSDYEILNDSDDETPIGRVFNDQLARIIDHNNEKHHFCVFEDHSVN